MKKTLFAILLLTISCATRAADVDAVIQIADPETWNANSLSAYIGHIVRFEEPMIITGRGDWGTGSEISISPRRIFTPTNQELPGTPEYYNLMTLNTTGTVKLTNAPKIATDRRTGVRIHDLVVRVTNTSSVSWISGTFVGNSREDLEKGIDMSVIDARGKHNLLVCAMNCEYYLTEQFGTGSSSTMGPANEHEHQLQRTKVSRALALINADLYGLVEVQKGSGAVSEIAADLNKNHPGRNFKPLLDNTIASGTYTKSGMVYDSNILEPLFNPIWINTIVADRKVMQAFRHIPTGETFIYSINHFKAKSGSGSGDDADRGDGQGGFNHSRVVESQAVLETYQSYARQLSVGKGINEHDILLMGDLNALGKEDPITTLTRRGMYDLHREFHADSSYSYTFRNQAGYLDHALCNGTMYGQVTGMMGFHINSDESDDYTYNGRKSDNSMFRCSDHDPVIVGLRLDSTLSHEPVFGVENNFLREGDVYINNALNHPKQETSRAFYRLFTTDGRLVYHDDIATSEILSNHERIALPANSGVYILIIYTADGFIHKERIIIP